jgi:hypothetical protein
MIESTLTMMLRLRLIVGFLGERSQFAWWPTAFYDSSSRPFLDPVFPRTSALTRYHAVVEVARRVHDEHLSVGSYHLFRMSEEVEQDFHALVQAGGEEMLLKESSLIELGRLAGPVSSQSIGPTLVGSIKNLNSIEIVQAIAASYLYGFEQNSRTYPYLVG